MSAEHNHRLYGRHKGRPLSPRRTALLTDVYPRLALDPSQTAPTRLGDLFPARAEAVHLEIGFGGGEHLIGEAERAPGDGFIGVEPFVNGMAKALAGIADRGLDNIRLFAGDASELLAWLPPASLASVDLLYPDPWPKKRHWKRRFVSEANLAELARTLIPGGTFRVASDIAAYVEWTLAHVAGHPDFEWTAEQADDWRRPFPGWLGTRYEEKALRAGRIPTYLAFGRR